MVLLGFIMDAFEIIFVVVPIVAVPLLAMPGVDPVWLAVLMAVNLQTSYMHPPLGPPFYLRGRAGDYHRHIYVGVIPFVRSSFSRWWCAVRAGACDRPAACALWALKLILPWEGGWPKASRVGGLWPTRARELRKAMTPQEVKLWASALMEVGGITRRQAARRMRSDFIC
jgi:hypothetical protein